MGLLRSLASVYAVILVGALAVFLIVYGTYTVFHIWWNFHHDVKLLLDVLW